MQPARMVRRIWSRIAGTTLPEAFLSSLEAEHVSVVTGASSGIGRETARGLASAGGTVWMVGRNPERTEAAVASVRESAGHERVYACRSDFSDLSSVRTLVAELGAKVPRLDVLVNNAGVWHPDRRLTAQGIEDSLGVNHLAHFVLTLGLVDALEEAGGRVVTVSSGLHTAAKSVGLDDPAWSARPYRSVEAYAESKLANVLFAKSLARRLRGATSVAVHPGDVATDVTRDSRWLAMGARLVAPLLLTPWEGAQTSLHAAIAEGARGSNGVYYADLAEAEVSVAAADEALQERLWAWSVEASGVRDPFGAH